MANLQALEHVIGFIEANPQEHTQDEWICGTGACFAGWACLLNGWKWFHGKEWSSADRVYCGRKPKIFDTTHTRHIRDVATEVLELDLDDAVILFWGTNSAKTLRSMVNDLANERKLAWGWVPVVGRHDVVTMQRLAEKTN